MSMLVKSKKEMIQRKAVLLLCVVILVAGFAVKMVYAGKVAFDYSPHDLGHPSEWEDVFPGTHLTYIQYLYRYRALPDMSPLDFEGQHYHCFVLL